MPTQADLAAIHAAVMSDPTDALAWAAQGDAIEELIGPTDRAEWANRRYEFDHPSNYRDPRSTGRAPSKTKGTRMKPVPDAPACFDQILRFACWSDLGSATLREGLIVKVEARTLKPLWDCLSVLCAWQPVMRFEVEDRQPVLSGSGRCCIRYDWDDRFQSVLYRMRGYLELSSLDNYYSRPYATPDAALNAFSDAIRAIGLERAGQEYPDGYSN